MALMENTVIRSFVASADLRLKQFFLVKRHTVAGQVALAGAGEDVVGVLLNKPNTNEVAEIGGLNGASKLKAVAGAAISLNAKVASDAAGKLRTAVSTDHIVGRAEQAATADLQVIEISTIGTGILP
jgi:hypothetical protein